MSLADLAARTGIPRATAFRLLSTLEQAVSVAGPIDRMPQELAGSDMTAAVRAAARAISVDLGAVEDSGENESYRTAFPVHGGST